MQYPLGQDRKSFDDGAIGRVRPRGRCRMAPGCYEGPVKRPYLERLVVNVAHDCNLRCGYCYADKGAYGQARTQLAPGLAERIAETFLARFERIGTIQLFGGEPFLNLRGVDGFCRHVAAVCEREGAPLPRFTAVTNGTLASDAVIRVVNDHRIALTVSLDGNRAIHDAQRVFAGGAGSFDRVVAGVKKLKAATGQPRQVEATFTAAHLAAGFSIADFMRFLAAELGVRRLHMPWILGEGAYDGAGIAPTDANVAQLAHAYRDAVDASLAALESPELADTVLLSQVDDAIRAALAGRAPAPRTHLCPAGGGTLSVGADGRVTPCFMFTNKPGFELADVRAFDDAGFDARRATFVRRLELPADAGGPFAIRAACAGQNHEVSGRVGEVSAANLRVQAAIADHLRRAVNALVADANRWSWVRCKLMLHQLEAGAPFEAVEC